MRHTPSQTYKLRRREPLKEKNDAAALKSQLNIVTKKKPILSITTLFNACRNKCDVVIEIGHLVLAKMHTYSPWPAKVMEVDGKKAKVFFFGTSNHGTVNTRDCLPIHLCSPVIARLKESKQSNLTKALSEMDLIIRLAEPAGTSKYIQLLVFGMTPVRSPYCCAFVEFLFTKLTCNSNFNSYKKKTNKLLNISNVFLISLNFF